MRAYLDKTASQEKEGQTTEMLMVQLNLEKILSALILHIE
jgi:hypothetical protein